MATMLPSSSNATLVPPFYLDCVAAIGYSGPGLQNNILVDHMWHTSGTGFFYGHLVEDDPDPAKRLYAVYLVTAKHVVDGYNKIRTINPQVGGMRIRVNPVNSVSEGKEFDLASELADTGTAWVPHPRGVDIAVLPINIKKLRDSNFQSMFFPSDGPVANTEKLKATNVSAGDGIFVLGFPMDLAGRQKNYVIVRQGVIARISELLDHVSDSFMIDSFVFPGNSGGPVILRPEIVSISGTPPPSNAAYLVGVVVEYLPYSDTAVSNQTGQARIVFQENSGLANVLPTDYITETILMTNPHK